MSLRFDLGTDRLYRTANLPGFNTPGVTVCGWAKRVSYAARSNCIIGLGDNASGSPTRSREIYWSDSGVLSWTWYGYGYDFGSFSIQPGTDWFFCAITSSGTEGRDALFYVGGAGDLTLEVATKYEATSNLTSLAIAFAGDNGWGEGGDFILDGWRVYDRALTAAELELERWMRRPSGVAVPNVWLPMLDNTSTTTQAQDYSGNGRNATTTGLAVQTDSAPVSWGASPIWVKQPNVTAQFLRPISDIGSSGWAPSSGVALYPMINEVVRNDTNYISANTAGAWFEFLLGTSAGDPQSSINHLPRITMSAGGGGITLRLKQGTTLIKEWVYTSLTASDTTYTPTLSGAEIDAITDYTDLRLYGITTA